jgi:hypothetical protein
VVGIIVPLAIIGIVVTFLSCRRWCYPQNVAPAPQPFALPQDFIFAAAAPQMPYGGLHLAVPPPDPSSHHRVPCFVAAGGALGLQLVPAHGGAGSVVHGVEPGTPVAAAVRPGDRLFSVGGVDVLMYPMPAAIALLQSAPRPLTLEFLRANEAAAGVPQIEDPGLPAVVKEGATFAALAPAELRAPPPDPALHHVVACVITRPGQMGISLAPADPHFGVGVQVDRVTPDTALEPAPQVGDRVYQVAGIDVLMAPSNEVIVQLQRAPRPAPVTFLRRHAPVPNASSISF